jgi:hypothetical protein
LDYRQRRYWFYRSNGPDFQWKYLLGQLHRLLHKSILCLGEYFKLLWSRSPTIIDFSSFQNGTIQGRIVITSNGAPLVIPSLTNFFVGLDGHGDPNGFSVSTVATVNIRSVTVVPEPSSFLLLGTGLLGALRAARKKLLG